MQTEFSDHFFAGVLMVKVYLCCFTQFTVDQSKVTVNGSVLSDPPNVRYLAALYERIRKILIKLQRKPDETRISDAQGQLTPKSVMGSDRNSNSSMLLCMSW